MYDKSAAYYDAIYSFKSYEKESKRLDEIIGQYKKSSGNTCLFSAIGHVKTGTKMRKAVTSMARHLKDGGILIVEPWFSPEQWKAGHMDANFVNQHDLKLARINISEREGKLSVNEMHYLVASKSGIRYFTERLEMGLFTPGEYLEAFETVGLDTFFDSEGLIGRGLYIGVKTAQ